MLWMRVSDLPVVSRSQDARHSDERAELLRELEDSLVKGWWAESPLIIADGKLIIGFLRFRALQVLLAEKKITSDYMVSIRILRTQLMPVLVDSETGSIFNH